MSAGFGAAVAARFLGTHEVRGSQGGGRGAAEQRVGLGVLTI